MSEVYTENKFFIFTFSHIPEIIGKFESTVLYYKEDNTTACGSSFATKEEALRFSAEINEMKRAYNENQYIVKHSLNPYWIHDLFTTKAVTPMNWGGVLVGCLN